MPGCFCFGRKKKKQKSLTYDISSENDEYIYEKLYIARRSARGREGNINKERTPNLLQQNSKNESTSIAVQPTFKIVNTQKQLRDKSKSYPSSPDHLRNYFKKHKENIFAAKRSTTPLIYTAHLLNCKKPFNSQQDGKTEPFSFQKSLDHPDKKTTQRDNNDDYTPYKNTDKSHLNCTYHNKENKTINNLYNDPPKCIVKTKHNSERSAISEEQKCLKQYKKPVDCSVEESDGKTHRQSKQNISLNYESKKSQNERIPQNNYTSEENLQNMKKKNNTYGYLAMKRKVQSNDLKTPVKSPEIYTVCNAEFTQDGAKKLNYNDTSSVSEKSYEHTSDSEGAEDKSGISDIPVSTSNEFFSTSQPVAAYVAHPYEDSGFGSRRNTRAAGRKSLAHNVNADPRINSHRETRNSDIAEGMMNSLLSSRNPNPLVPRKGYRMSTEYDILSSDRRRQSVTREKDFLINIGKGQHLPPTQDELVTDILNTYSSIFVENLKDPIPKDPLNKPKAYNIIPPPRLPRSRKTVSREQKQISTSKRKSGAFKQQPTHMPDHTSTQGGYKTSAVTGEPRKSIARPRVSSARQTIMNRRATAYGGRRRTVLVMPPAQQGYERTHQNHTPPSHYESRPLTPNREYAEPRKSVARPRISSARLPVYHTPTNLSPDDDRRTTAHSSLPRKSVYIRPNSNSPPSHRRQTIIVNQRRQTIADGQGKRLFRRPTTALMPRRSTAVTHMPHTPGGRPNTYQVYTANISEVDFSKISGNKNLLYKKESNTALLPSDNSQLNEYDSVLEHENNTETQNRSTELLGTRCIGPSEPKEYVYQKGTKTYVNSQVQTDYGSDNEADLFFCPTKKYVKKAAKVTTGNKLRWKIVIKRSDHSEPTKSN